MSVCLALSETLLLKEPSKGQKVARRHLEVGIVKEQNLQQQCLLPQALREPPRYLSLCLQKEKEQENKNGHEREGKKRE